MRIAVSLLDTTVGVNLVHTLPIPIGGRHCIWARDLSKLRIATKAPLQLDGLILVHLGLGNFYTRV